MQIVSKLWLCSNTFLNYDCVIYFQLSDKSIQSLFPSWPQVFPISARFHWHLLCAPGSSRVVRQALSPALSWAQWDASFMEAWRSYCNANCIFPPSASPLLLVGGWRWHHMVQGLSCLEIKQLHRLAQKGRVIRSCKNIYKCRVQFEIERKQQTFKWWCLFFFSKLWTQVSPQPVRAPHFISWGCVERTTLSPCLGSHLIKSILFMAEIHSFLPFPLLRYCPNLLLAWLSCFACFFPRKQHICFQ